MIKSAAIKYNDKIYTGKTHSDIINSQDDPLILFSLGENGFLTDRDEFLDRIEAGKHALECGQIKRLDLDGRLYSGDLL